MSGQQSPSGHIGDLVFTDPLGFRMLKDPPGGCLLPRVDTLIQFGGRGEYCLLTLSLND